MKKYKVFFWTVLLLLALLAFWFVFSKLSRRAFLKFEGMVLDQYGLPVPGAPVTTAYPYSRGYTSDGFDRGFNTEYDRVYSDESGHYSFNSRPRLHNYAEVWSTNAFDSDGNFIEGSSHLTFRYEPSTGWTNGAVSTYDLNSGWQNKEPKKGDPVILRVNRTSGIKRIGFTSGFVKGDSTGGQACFNANDGKLHPIDSIPCDFMIKVSPCALEKGNWYEISSPQGGGVIPYVRRKMSTGEAPPGDYPQTLRMADSECPSHPSVDEWPKNADNEIRNIFFYSRNQKVHGRVRIERHPLSENPVNTMDSINWVELIVWLNPRGDRTLTSKIFTDSELPMLRFPLEIPYIDPWVIDYSKIEVGEDKKKGEVFVHGHPGAIPKGEVVSIKNRPPDEGENEKSDFIPVKADGSFSVSLKADLRGRIYLTVLFKKDNPRANDQESTIIPLTKLVKLTQEAKQ